MGWQDDPVSESVVEPNALRARPLVGQWHNGRKLSHLIAHDLRGMILRGELSEGQALPPETDLLRAFEVSRDTLREALRILESEALIEIRRGRRGGAVVQRPRSGSVTRYVSLLLQVRGTSVGDILEARLVLEPRAAAGVAASSPAAVEHLWELHEAARSHVEDPLACVEALNAFDREVIRQYGNPTIAVVSGVFRDLIASQAYVAGLQSRGAPILLGVAEGHRAFLDAIPGGDPKELEAAWTAYLSGAAELLADDRGDVASAVATPVAQLHAAYGEGRGAEKLAASIAATLRLRMAEGSLVAGDQLPALPELAAEFGVSRPTIRECLRVLEVEGLVDLRTGSRTGARILEPTTETAAKLASILLAGAGTRMIDVLEARQLIEPAVMGLMVTRADADAVAELAEEVATLARLVDDTPAFVEQIGRFERLAFAATGNTAITVALEMIHWVNVRARHDVLVRALTTPKLIRTNRRAAEYAAAVVAAAERGDVEGAQESWTSHFDSILPYFRAAWGEREIVDLFD